MPVSWGFRVVSRWLVLRAKLGHGSIPDHHVESQKREYGPWEGKNFWGGKEGGRIMVLWDRKLIQFRGPTLRKKHTQKIIHFSKCYKAQDSFQASEGNETQALLTSWYIHLCPAVVFRLGLQTVGSGGIDQETCRSLIKIMLGSSTNVKRKEVACCERGYQGSVLALQALGVVQLALHPPYTLEGLPGWSQEGGTHCLSVLWPSQAEGESGTYEFICSFSHWATSLCVLEEKRRLRPHLCHHGAHCLKEWLTSNHDMASVPKEITCAPRVSE